MIDLAEILSLPAPTATVVLRGRTLPVRCPTSAESDDVNAALPEPAVPLTPQPGMGSAAPRTPNHDDPAYLQRRSVVWGRRLAAKCAVALDTAIDGIAYPACPPAEREAWIRRAADMVRQSLSDREMQSVIEAATRNTSLAHAVEEARKNS